MIKRIMYCGTGESKMSFTLDTSLKPDSVWIKMLNPTTLDLKDYFNNWENPTQEELELFKLEKGNTLEEFIKKGEVDDGGNYSEGLWRDVSWKAGFNED